MTVWPDRVRCFPAQLLEAHKKVFNQICLLHSRLLIDGLKASWSKSESFICKESSQWSDNKQYNRFLLVYCWSIKCQPSYKRFSSIVKEEDWAVRIWQWDLVQSEGRFRLAQSDPTQSDQTLANTRPLLTVSQTFSQFEPDRTGRHCDEMRS